MEDYARILGPGPAKIEGSRGDGLTRCSRDRATVDDEVSRVGAGGATLRGDSAFGVGQDTDVAVVEPGIAGLAEDEVDGAFDVALCVDLDTCLGKDGVW